jgi:hypothetical protein
MPWLWNWRAESPVAADRHHIFEFIRKMTAELAELSRAMPVYPDIEPLRPMTCGAQPDVE